MYLKKRYKGLIIVYIKIIILSRREYVYLLQVDDKFVSLPDENGVLKVNMMK